MFWLCDNYREASSAPGMDVFAEISRTLLSCVENYNLRRSFVGTLQERCTKIHNVLVWTKSNVKTHNKYVLVNRRNNVLVLQKACDESVVHHNHEVIAQSYHPFGSSTLVLTRKNVSVSSSMSVVRKFTFIKD